MVCDTRVDQTCNRISVALRPFRLGMALGVWLLVGASTMPAQAQAPVPSLPEQVELRFNGGPGCPAQATFVREVAARVRRPVEWVLTNAETQITVTVVQTADHATGTLQVVTRAAEPTQREFVASTCAEISSALALVTALTLDPNARTDALPPPAAVAPEATPGVAVAGPAAPPPPAPEPSQPPAPRPVPPQPSPRRQPSALVHRYVAWLGPAIGVDGGYAPDALVLVGLSLGARARVTRLFSPSVQLTPLWGKTGVTGPAASAGIFAWALARLEACPTSLALADWLSFEPCLSGEIGRLSAAGDSSTAAIVSVPVERWWAAGGAALALHASRGRWFARLESHGLLPATRDEFVFEEPHRRIHQPAWFAYGATLALGVQLGR